MMKAFLFQVALINQAVVTKGLATWVEPAPYH